MLERITDFHAHPELLHKCVGLFVVSFGADPANESCHVH